MSVSRVPADFVLSTQVSASRYFFLALTGRAVRGVMPAYGGFERCDPDFFVRRDGFAFATLELVVAGRGTVRLDGVAHPLRPGALFHYGRRTHCEIRCDPDAPMSKYFLCLTGTRAEARLRAAGLRSGGLVHLAMFAEVQRLFDGIILEGARARAATKRLCAAWVEVLLLKIEELAGAAGPASDAAEETFLRCKQVIESRAARLATLGDITRAAGVEASHLCRLFRRYQGVSPYQFLLRRKMSLAAEMLMDPRMLVKTAALQVGFRDPYHFSRCFKRVHQVAPSAFRHTVHRHPSAGQTEGTTNDRI